MSLGLVMVVRDEEKVIRRCLDSVEPLISEWHIVDTGSADRTRQKIARWLAAQQRREDERYTDDGHLPGGRLDREWTDFGTAREQALDYARSCGEAEWLLMLDADMTVEWHPDLLTWLDGDPDPEVMAWQVEIAEAGVVYRLPLLIRRTALAAYIGPTHEYLLLDEGSKQRPLLGLIVTHHCDGGNRATKHDRDIELLADAVEQGDPRAIFYTAQALACLGRLDEATALYRRRAEMGGFEEEAWFAEYQAAKLDADPELLTRAWGRRPWRHEPLTEAARLVRERGPEDDFLFLEQ